VLGFSLLLNNARMINIGEVDVSNQHDEPVIANLFEV